MKGTMTSRRGVGYVTANGSSIENYGEKNIVGLTDDGEAASMWVQRADSKKALRLAVRKTRINYEEG